MKEQINSQVLCVLKKTKFGPKVELGYEPIENKLPPELNNLYNLCESNSDGAGIINFIDGKPELQKILGRYNYCSSLSAAYEGLRDINKEIKEHFNISEEFSSVEERDKFLKGKRESLKSIFKQRELAYNIDLAYQQCAKNSFIIAYSHREVGWTTKCKLSSDFQIEFKTNFGYGWVSYFYTKLKFKDIDIIPFSEWVTYRNSQYETLIQYSQSHSLKHESWYDAISYVCEAYNMSIEDEVAFISKYLLSECETMAKGLESMLVSSSLQFKEIKGTHPHGPFSGHQIVEVKGEKISGALKFIQSILTYEKVLQVKEFIKRIETCNTIIQPVLVNQVAVIIKELEPLVTDFDIIEPKYEEMSKVAGDYSIKKKSLKEGLEKTEDFSLSKLEEAFTQKYPEFKSFEENFRRTQTEYLNLRDKITALESTRKKIEKYNKAIDEYFQVKVDTTS